MNGLVLTVDERDEMFHGAWDAALGFEGLALTGYFNAGLQVADVVTQVADWRFGGLARVGALLDFACGYGRVTRFLASGLSPDRVWAADIYTDGVRFVHEQFGVHGVPSVLEPTRFTIDRRFDCIVVASLFSHLPERTFCGWLQTLYGLLSERGVLVFSVQDESVMDAGRTMPPEGIAFVADSESGTLSPTAYGVTFVTEAFVTRAIATATEGDRIHRRLPRAFGQAQDVYVVVRGDDEGLATWDFQFGPQGFVDRAGLSADGTLSLQGWAADPTPGGAVRSVDVLVNGAKVAGQTPSLPRPDVARHLGDEAHGSCGFHVVSEGTIVRPEDVVLVKAVTERGGRVLHCGTVAETVEFLRLQPIAEQERRRKVALDRRFDPILRSRRGLARLPALVAYHYQLAGVPGIVSAAVRFATRSRRPARAVRDS